MNEYFFKRGLLKQKQRAIFEVTHDIKYIETFKKDMLEYDETPARKRLAVLKKKTDLTDTEGQEMDAIIDTLSESKAVKNEHEKSKKLLQDLHNYISII